MSTRKQRLTVTVDPELVAEGTQAVASGRAESLSGWVTTALAEKVDRDAKLAALDDAVSAYEAEFGEISDDELAAQERSDREAATVVRGTSRRGRPALPARSSETA